MKKRTLGKLIINSFTKGVVFLVLLLVLFFSSANKVFAQVPADVIGGPAQIVSTTKDSIWKVIGEALKKAGSTALQSAIRNTLSTMAAQTATWLGSGGEGQKPLFLKGEWGEFAKQQGDAAAGAFLDSINEQFNVNLCQPNLAVQANIAFGLTNYVEPPKPNCSASNMFKAWTDEFQRIKDMKASDFLNKAAGMFDPTGNDTSVSLSLIQGMAIKMEDEETKAWQETTSKKGWLDVRDLGGNAKTLPEDAKAKKDFSEGITLKSFGTVTGDAFVDAINVFSNQLLITSIQTMQKKIAQGGPEIDDFLDKIINGTRDKYGNIVTTQTGTETPIVKGNTQSDIFTKADAPFVTPSAAAIESYAKQKTQATFKVNADYDILGRLLACPDPKNPGPMDCVIEDKFMQAITEQRTIGDALNLGYLNKDWVMQKGGDYKNSYSYRSALILRKYRILPVGWERAILLAEEESLKQNSPIVITLKDIVSCFSDLDNYDEYSIGFGRLSAEDRKWCKGLVDPTWVLRLPQHFCAKSGYGGYIVNKTVVDTDGVKDGGGKTSNELLVTRMDDYCADEKSCIKEEADGSCNNYGYCTEENRVWSFGAESCEPIYNTCDTFKRESDGRTLSLLKNTLTFCNSSGAGCRAYYNGGYYDVNAGKFVWSTLSSTFFNSGVDTCSETEEGCRKLMTISYGNGENLVMDSDLVNEEVKNYSTSDLNVFRINNDIVRMNTWNFKPSGEHTIGIIDKYNDPTGVLAGSSDRAWYLSAADGISLFSNHSYSVFPDNFSIIPGYGYTLSADVYLKTGDKITMSLGGVGSGGIGAYTDNLITIETTEKNKWQRLTLSRVGDRVFNEPNFEIYSNDDSPTFYVKNIKFEIGDRATTYSAYSANTVIHERLTPEYLRSACYTNLSAGSYQAKTNAPEICKNYAALCKKEEVGCEKYTSEDGFMITGKVLPTDYCDVQCANYDTYIQKANYFNSESTANFIPTKAQSCSAQAVGCNEFTNLDKLAAGGESREYYSQLKQCQKPDNTCETFYYWEGNTSGGYQLHSVNVKKNPSTGSPAVTDATLDADCQANYDKKPGDVGYNPDCREFYDNKGKISHHLASLTITCSDNCKSYRLSEKNLLSGKTQATCPTSDAYHWEANSLATNGGYCYICKNGGKWDTNQQACVYWAIPGEGKVCANTANGCREYAGNKGNKVRIAAAYSFEGTDESFTSNSGTQKLENVSNKKGGQSLSFTANTSKTVGNLVKQNYAYNLRFSLKTSVNQTLSIYFTGKSCSLSKKTCASTSDCTATETCQTNTSYFNALQGKEANDLDNKIEVIGDGDWHFYQIALSSLDHAVTENETLSFVISSSPAQLVYLDDVVINEVSDRYYVIKDSWQIPDVCYYDINHEYQGMNYNLGCRAYTSRVGGVKYLRQFTQVCTDGSAGCKMMVDTNNFDYNLGVTKNLGISGDDNGNGICDSGETSCVNELENDTNKDGICGSGENDCRPKYELKVPRHSIIYAVDDNQFACNPLDDGCSRFGMQPDGINWRDTYIKNNPIKYDSTLCTSSDVGCDSWQDSKGTSYFRDPGMNLCEWRSSGGIYDWFKVKLNRCDKNNNGKIDGPENQTEYNSTTCLEDNDCKDNAGSHSCLLDENDYSCSVTTDSTFGLGGPENVVKQPKNSAGLCEARASSCTEYIDPVSSMSENLLIDGTMDECIDPKKTFNNCQDFRWWARMQNFDNALNSSGKDDYTATGKIFGALENKNNGVIYYKQRFEIKRNKLYVFSSKSQGVKLTCPGFDINRNSGWNPLSIVYAGGTCKFPNGGYCKINDKNEVVSVNAGGNCTFYKDGFCQKSDNGATTLKYLNNNNVLVPATNNILERNANGQNDFIFSVSKNDNSDSMVTCEVMVDGGIKPNTSVREAKINYVIANDLQKDSCNGVDGSIGCQLFNERSFNGLSGYAKMTFDAYNSPINGNSANSNCGTANSVECNTNTIAKVKPSRVCGKWLACQTKREEMNKQTGNIEETCYGWGECDKMDEKKNCIHFVQNSQRPHLEDRSMVNSSGYIRTNSYLISEMKERGEKDVSFSFGKSSGGQGDCSSSKALTFEDKIDDCNQDRINGPDEASGAIDGGVAYPAEGKAFLKITNKPATLTFTAVKGANYYVGYLINTKGSTVNVSWGSNNYSDFTQNEWKRMVRYIHADSSGDITIKFDGTFFIDDIRVSLALITDINHEDCSSGTCKTVYDCNQNADQCYLNKECRLYPSASALTCKSESQSAVVNGLEGYCLEHDPLNKDVCLLWWPVDNVAASDLDGAKLSYEKDLNLKYCTNIEVKYGGANDSNYIRKWEVKKVWQHTVDSGALGTMSFTNLSNVISSTCEERNDSDYGPGCRSGGYNFTNAPVRKIWYRFYDISGDTNDDDEIRCDENVTVNGVQYSGAKCKYENNEERCALPAGSKCEWRPISAVYNGNGLGGFRTSFGAGAYNNGNDYGLNYNDDQRRVYISQPSSAAGPLVDCSGGVSFDVYSMCREYRESGDGSGMSDYHHHASVCVQSKCLKLSGFNMEARKITIKEVGEGDKITIGGKDEKIFSAVKEITGTTNFSDLSGASKTSPAGCSAIPNSFTTKTYFVDLSSNCINNSPAICSTDGCTGNDSCSFSCKKWNNATDESSSGVSCGEDENNDNKKEFVGSANTGPQSQMVKVVVDFQNYDCTVTTSGYAVSSENNISVPAAGTGETITSYDTHMLPFSASEWPENESSYQAALLTGDVPMLVKTDPNDSNKLIKDRESLVCTDFSMPTNDFAWYNRLSKGVDSRSTKKIEITPGKITVDQSGGGFGGNWGAVKDADSNNPCTSNCPFKTTDDNSGLTGLPFGCDGENCNKLSRCGGDKGDTLCLTGAGNLPISCSKCGGNGSEEIFAGPVSGSSKFATLDNMVFKKPTKNCLIDYPTDYKTTLRNCYIQPSISNVILTDGRGAEVSLKGNSLKINSDGYYVLSFNTTVDIEQRPLKDIIIDWGDGRVDFINQDARPDASSPHKLSHYYFAGSTSGSTISIEIKDNWINDKNTIGYASCGKTNSCQ
jgi:hypothetical protein